MGEEMEDTREGCHDGPPVQRKIPGRTAVPDEPGRIRSRFPQPHTSPAPPAAWIGIAPARSQNIAHRQRHTELPHRAFLHLLSSEISSKGVKVLGLVSVASTKGGNKTPVIIEVARFASAQENLK